MSAKSLFLVLTQLALLVYFTLIGLLGPEMWQLVLLALGFVLILWAFVTMGITNFNIQPELRSKTLITKGPYRLIRHPMYTGVLLMILPSLFFDFSLWRLAAFAILIIVFLIKIQMEEQFLRQRFRESYYRYQKTSYRLLPWIY
ncbi:MAG: isoprenylcysteine carboxylmethyltransferase family protein [Dokdonia sp.]|jgi:protein-S-isoprenylcysteine O-methyltransferase Ste14|nr:isoprenylcysteine carboxyl methyltransferase [Cytophagaceae bacterium]